MRRLFSIILVSIILLPCLCAQTKTISGIVLGGDKFDAIRTAAKDYPRIFKTSNEGNEDDWDWAAQNRDRERGETDSFISLIYLDFENDCVSQVSYQFARYTFSPYAAAYNERNMLEYYERYYDLLRRQYGNPDRQDGYDFLWRLPDSIVNLSTEYEYDPSHSLTYYAIRIDYLETGNGAGIALDGSGEYYASGSGFFLNSNGYLATNYHVIEGARGIDVFVNQNGEVKTFTAREVISDKQNDLSILKIDDSYLSLPPLPFAISFSVKDVGSGVFALGYPMSNILGEEIKVTDGIISSRTGFQGDVTTYQISAPIQPGNSGGPLFSDSGELIGITNAGVPDAQNVGYAIKTSYLRNLIESAPVSISVPSKNTIAGMSLPEKIKRLSPYIVLIKIR